MAKKKAASELDKKLAAKKPASRSTLQGRTLSNDDIGEVAGQVWQLLHDKGQQSPASLKKEINAPGDLVATALGWLAREGKLDFQVSGRSVKISLRKSR